MSDPVYTQEFWEGAVIDWLMKNAGLRRERVDLQRKFTQEPYNMSVVRVLNMMDDMVDIYKGINKNNLVLSQNWRLAHRVDRVGDFISAFFEVVAAERPSDPSNNAGSAPGSLLGNPPASSEPSTSPAGQMSETGQRATHNRRLEALRSDPNLDWTAADLEIIASQYALKFRKVTGTHEVFLHPSVADCVTVPLKQKIRAPHIKAFVAMIDRMEAIGR
jgi:hypothetical protein